MPNSSGSDLGIDRRPIFDGPKVSLPIRFSERWHYHWLVQLSLDTNITDIATVETDWPTIAGSLSLTLTYSNGDRRRALGVRTACDKATLAQVDGWAIYLREDVRRSVRSSNALAVWACREIRVDLATRMAILKVIERQGGTSRFADILDQVQSDPAPLATILGRLRCDGLVDFDLARVLSLDTLVSLVGVSSDKGHAGAIIEAESVDTSHKELRQSKPP